MTEPASKRPSRLSIRLARPTIEDDDLAAVREALTSGQLVQGPRVRAFEERLAALVGTPHAVAVTNCTAALQLALLALGLRAGDLVLVPAYSWIATANVVELCGAQPVFVDIDARTFCMDPGALAARLALLQRTPSLAGRIRAVMPVHAFGQMADMNALARVAGDIPLVEDAACALGAAREGHTAGATGVLGCFSFHPRKAVTTGEGGAIVTGDAALARRLRVLRNHGQDPEVSPADFLEPGFNARMTEMQAALGYTQLGKLDRITQARRRLAARYGQRFAHGPITAPHAPESSDPVYQSYVVLLPGEMASGPATAIRALRDLGIEASIGTTHMPLATYYRARYGYSVGDFPATDSVTARALTLPLYESMTDAEVDLVASALLEIVARG